MDTLSGRDLTIEIEREIQRFHNRSSVYHKIEYLVGERERALDLLYECVQQLNHSTLTDRHFSLDLEKICDCIDHVRKTSMLISESTWEMFEQFRYTPGKKGQAALGSHYLRLFQHFDEDLRFLRESVMKYYICFSEGFDPLLLVFRLNASYLYRLLRAHQRISAHYMLSKDLEAIQDQESYLL